MVHSVVLVDLRQKKTQHLTFDPKNIKDYSGPIDDIIVFAHSARISGKNFSLMYNNIFFFSFSNLILKVRACVVEIK